MKKEALIPVMVFAEDGADIRTLVEEVFRAFLREKLTALEKEGERYV